MVERPSLLSQVSSATTTGFNKSIHMFFTKDVVNVLTAIPPISDKVPCPGLGCDTYLTVAGYIKQTLAPGGGALNRPTIARSIFGHDVAYTELSEDDKKQVLQRESHLYLWRIVHAAGSVYSTECKEMVPVKSWLLSSCMCQMS